TTFSAGDVLTVYDPVINGIEKVNVIGSGTGFSNSDVVVSVSTFLATVTLGTPTVGQYLTNGNGITNVQIVSATSTTTANQYAIGIAPRNVDLANGQCNSSYWTFAINDSLINLNSTLTMTVNQVIGAGFIANVITNGVGTIQNIAV